MILFLVSAWEKKKNAQKNLQIKPLMCKVCGTGFTRLYNLQRHIKKTTHAQEVPLDTEREEPRVEMTEGNR